MGVPQFVVQGAGCGSHAYAWQKYEIANIVDQVQVDVQHGGRAVGFGNHHVGVPQFVVQGAGCGSHAYAWQKYEIANI
ncbi:hypothetical protein C7E12_21685, partial [Stenotrophomonas maltophilia]